MQTSDYVSTLFDAKTNPDKVTVAFTMAFKAVSKGYSATVILMAAGVHMGRPGYADDMDIGEPFRPVADLMKDYLDNGGQIVVCSSCAEHSGLSREQIDPRFEIITANEVIDLVMNAKGNLQIT
jgi:predicted peroxiredoxin